MSAVHAEVRDYDSRSWAEVDFFDNPGEDPDVYLEVVDGSSPNREPIHAVAIFTPEQAMEVAKALAAAAQAAGYEAEAIDRRAGQ